MTGKIGQMLLSFSQIRNMNQIDPRDNATETRNTVQWPDYGGTGPDQLKVAGRVGGMNSSEIEPKW